MVGLGLLGGGVATANWLVKHGADLTITDLKNKRQLASSLKRLKGKFKLLLGGHSEQDIKNTDIVVLNPDVRPSSPVVKWAKKHKKPIENEITIFSRYANKPMVAVTGTRGKTTTVNWVGHFLSGKYRAVVTGNSYKKPFLASLDSLKRYDYIAAEVPSFQLEFLNHNPNPPDTVVVTNLSQDHLNWHGNIKKYALAKSKLFKGQSTAQNLILNYNNSWTKFFIDKNPKSKIYFFSLKTLPKKFNGIYKKNSDLFFQDNGSFKKIVSVSVFEKKLGEHNVQNLMAAMLATYLSGVPWLVIKKGIKTLPQIEFRQEVVSQKRGLTIVNDTTATSPEGAIAALKRFGSPSTILIAGGTDRDLDFKQWAKEMPKYIKTENVIFLSGSATDKMLRLLGGKFAKHQIFDTLARSFECALLKSRSYRRSVILFSPAAKSFEKFKNEYDRGRQFNQIVQKMDR